MKRQSVVTTIWNILRSKKYGYDASTGLQLANQIYNEMMEQAEGFRQFYILKFYSESSKRVVTRIGGLGSYQEGQPTRFYFDFIAESLGQNNIRQMKVGNIRSIIHTTSGFELMYDSVSREFKAAA